MVKDMVNTYFNGVVEAFKAEYGDFTYSQTRNDSPKTYPSVYFRQLGGEDAALTLSGTAEAQVLDIEIQIAHNKTVGKTREMADFIRGVMNEQGFRCTMFSPLESATDGSVKVFVARYSKLETTQKKP